MFQGLRHLRRRTIPEAHPLWNLVATGVIDFLHLWIKNIIVIDGLQSTMNDDAFSGSSRVRVRSRQGQQPFRSRLPPDHPPLFVVNLASEKLLRSAGFQERVSE